MDQRSSQWWYRLQGESALLRLYKFRRYKCVVRYTSLSKETYSMKYVHLPSGIKVMYHPRLLQQNVRIVLGPQVGAITQKRLQGTTDQSGEIARLVGERLKKKNKSVQ